MASEPLKACPFCGAEVSGEASVCDYIVLCRPCGVKMRRNSEHSPVAIAAWNRRAPSPAVRALVEACKRFSEGWIYCREDDYEGACCEPCSDVSRMREALAAVEREIQ